MHFFFSFSFTSEWLQTSINFIDTLSTLNSIQVHFGKLFLSNYCSRSFRALLFFVLIHSWVITDFCKLHRHFVNFEFHPGAFSPASYCTCYLHAGIFNTREETKQFRSSNKMNFSFQVHFGSGGEQGGWKLFIVKRICIRPESRSVDVDARCRLLHGNCSRCGAENFRMLRRR